MITKREWFRSERDAGIWMNGPAQGMRAVHGPLKHIVRGKPGIISLLNTYAR